MTISVQCITCKHYIGAGACLAYPDQIPAEILSGIHDHKKPYPGDNDIRYEPGTLIVEYKKQIEKP